MVEAPRGGQCLAARRARPRQADAQAVVAGVLASRGVQPGVVQSDRGRCFLGARERQRAVPGRLTMWLWSLGIEHRLSAPGQPEGNGAVERWQGALERSWRGEPDGLAALMAVWNQGKQVRTPATTPYAGRAGSAVARVWAGLGGVRVARRVSGQGTVSLWNRTIHVGRALAQQEVHLTFDAASERMVVHDAHERRVRELSLPWLTLAWLWDPVPVPDQVPHPGDSTMTR